jgi:peptidyl-prolyl cis-trans isomerase C
MDLRRRLIVFIVIGLCVFLVSACNHNNAVTTNPTTMLVRTETETETVTPAPSPTPIPPTETSTPIPLAAIVNGESITLDEFMEELNRFQVASTITGTNLASDTNTIVLDELIDQTLLAQSAAQDGFVVDDTMLQAKISSLESQLDGADALEQWKTAQGYTDDSFLKALKRSTEAAWMRDQIISAVPETADEVYIKQILLPTETEADQVYASLQSGTDFQELAAKYDPLTEGDLGWFPRGYLDDPVIEDAAFALQPGQYSQVVETNIGYHILYLAERDASHTLQPDALKALQKKVLQDWVRERRNQSKIEIFVP